MTDRAAHDVVAEFWQTVCGGDPSALQTGFSELVAPDAPWEVSSPIGSVAGEEALERCLKPLVEALALTSVSWHVLISDRWKDGATYVSATGYLRGTHHAPWLGIAATGEPAALRFGALHRVDGNRIVASWVLLDVLDLAYRAGVPNLPGRYDRSLVPAPGTGDGVVTGQRDEAATAATRQLVESMIDGLGTFDGTDLGSMGMERFWDPDMGWYGPGGIGTTIALRGFEDLHQRPFLASFPDRGGGDHVARLASDAYFASGGWPSVRATHSGAPYLGVPARGGPVEMRVMDWWRRGDDGLAENWVLIDMPHLLEQLGHALFVGGELRPSGVRHG